MPIAPLETLRLSGLENIARLGLAVSGGGDSLAMLYLAHRAGLRPDVATVDHGLRAESAAEAAMVAKICADLGLHHTTLHWQNWDQRGNLQDAARRARRTLLATWAQARGLNAVALGHTRDDLAETFLMRLARGAGVDGLAAMRSDWTENGTRFLRPMLALARADLRSFLRSMGAEWADDPSNEMARFDRVRARKALALLHPLGLTGAGLAGVAQHLAQSRDALTVAADALAQLHLHQNAGIVTIAAGLFFAPPELQRRLIQRIILWLAPADYAPRGTALERLRTRLAAGQPAQLGGAHFVQSRGQIHAFREARAPHRTQANQCWDGVWHLQSPPPQTGEIGPLGAAGLAQWPNWRRTQLPRAALLSQPALWDGAGLMATPLMPQSVQIFQFLHMPTADSLFHMSLSH